MYRKKMVIIGIDSATFNIINPMIRDGKLPNLSRLMERGTSGQLESTFPPVTPPAWVSFMTGKNPGKHGVFDFYASPSYGYVRPPMNAKYIKSKTIWRILSDAGLKIGIINLPITQPPEMINGFIIPGIQISLNEGESFSYPPEIIHEIRKRFGEYRVYFGDLESSYTSNLDKFISEWRNIFEVRKQSILYLMKHKEWDVFMPVFFSVDSMQHHFWKYFDKEHPLYDADKARTYGDIIPEFYEKIDNAIGEILKHLDEDIPVMVVSDHGAGPEKGSFYMNNWLYQEGFLTFKKTFSPLWRLRFPHLFYKVLKRLKFPGIAWTVPLDKLKAYGVDIDPREGLNIPFFIDWKRTKAYAGNHTEQGIYINLKGREPLGIIEKGQEYEHVRDSVIKKLKEIQDPATGGPLDIQVYKKEELYQGPYTDDAADIFVKIKNVNCIMQKEIYHKKLFGLPKRTSGTHRFEGVFILKGSGIKTNFTVKGARIIDIAPTILTMLGIPVPEDMDGRMLKEVFTEDYLKNHPVNHTSASEIDVKRGEGVFSEEDSEKVRKALRDLGYF